MRLSSGDSDVELCTVPHRRPQDVDPSARQGDQHLVVSLALRPFAIVERPGLWEAAEAREGRLVEDPLGDPVASALPAVVVGAFSGVAGCAGARPAKAAS